jgi:hypothetical protein
MFITESFPPHVGLVEILEHQEQWVRLEMEEHLAPVDQRPCVSSYCATTAPLRFSLLRTRVQPIRNAIRVS